MKKIIMKGFLLVCLGSLASAGFATEKDFKVCTAGGYFSGAQDRFLSGLAMHITVKKGFINNHVCSVLWKNSYAAGENFAKTGKISNEEEAAIVQDAAEFSAAVYDLLSSKLNF